MERKNFDNFCLSTKIEYWMSYKVLNIKNSPTQKEEKWNIPKKENQYVDRKWKKLFIKD